MTGGSIDTEKTFASQQMAPELEAGVLWLVPASPNPAGGIDQLFLFCGDAVSAPVSRITGAFPAKRADAATKLHVFHFNDLHNHLTDQSGAAKGTHRFSQMVRRVGDARRKNADDSAVLFLSIGDDHTGSVFDELLGWRESEFVTDSGYLVYSAAGVDCTVLGNHEFDRGSALLARGIRQDARFPVLSANVHSSSHLVPGTDYHPAAIAVCNGLRIGLIGLTTQIETRVGQPGDPGLAVASPVTALTNVLPAIEPLVDVVLILSHCGYGDGEHKSGKAAAERDIGEADVSIARAAAPMSEKPLLVIGAHTHTVLNRNGLKEKHVFDGVPVLQAGSNGQYLGEIGLDTGAGRGTVTACLHAIKPRGDAVAGAAADPIAFERDGDFDAAFEAAHIAPLIDQVGGILTNEIASVETEALSFRHAVAQRYTGGCTLIYFMCDAIVARMDLAGFDVDFAMVNGGSILAGIEPGILTLGEWFDVMPYPDEVQIVTMTCEELDALLHSNAKRILRPEETASIDVTGFLPRGFLHTSGQVRYRLDLGNSAAEAGVGSIEYCGSALDDLNGRQFKVAVPAYLALGAFGERWNGRPISGGVPGAPAGFDLRALPRVNTGLIFRNEVAEFIRAAGTIDQNSVPVGDDRLRVR